MEDIPESYLLGHPKPFSFSSIKKINEQMEKCICKIKFGKEQATGIFTKITISAINKIISVLILCNHTHDKQLEGNESFSLDIKSEKNMKTIDLKGRKYYTDEKYDTTIIELKEKDNINHFLELDEQFTSTKYIDETLYILHYPSGELSVSFGTLKNIYEDKPYLFQHLCSTQRGSSGGAILNADNKLIGIHKGGCKNKENEKEENYNLGIFLNYPILEFIKQNFEDVNLPAPKEVVDNNDINSIINKINDSQNEINLSEKYIGNEGLKKLSNRKLKNLTQLILAENNITNIQSLTKFKLDTLEILNLNNNKIEDIKPLEKIKFFKLSYLGLMDNIISDISVLEKINLTKLTELLLSNNRIENIQVLEKVKSPNILILDLHSNKIKDISILSKVNYKSLEELNLSQNQISDIAVFEKVEFPNLKFLYLKENKISNINVLSKVKFPILQKLLLDDNNISDIQVLSQIKFVKLRTLSLTNNKIDKEKNDSFISRLKGKINI